jgi:2'-5' RNA ligase
MDSKRLFVALWPSPAVQRELAALVADEPRGVAVPPQNLHLTLAFLGSSTALQEACYRRALLGLKFSPMALDISCFGFWREPRILWTGPKETPTALLALVERIHALLQPCGFAPESRPFQSHITLKRKFSGSPPDWGVRSLVHWRADTTALVWSQSTPQGVRYQPLLRLPATEAPLP